MTDLQRLLGLAEKATPGPWARAFHGVVREYHPETVCLHSAEGELSPDAAFIAAADPQTVLSLLDRIRDLEVENRHLLPVSHELRNADLRDMQKRLDAAERMIDFANKSSFKFSGERGSFDNLLAEYREMSK